MADETVTRNPPSGEDAILAGDFRVLKFDGMFHVVFRPESDPEWFRIIASFYTYERAYAYCDVERVMFYDGESCTSDEERHGLRQPPIFQPPASQAEVDSVAEVVRNIYAGGEHVAPLPYEPPQDQPEDEEEPKDYEARLFEKACQDIAKEADAPILPETVEPAAPDLVSDEPLTDQQSAVLEVLAGSANPAGLVSLSLNRIARDAKVPHGSISFLLESLEKKRLMSVVERGRAGQTTIYRVTERQAA